MSVSINSPTEINSSHNALARGIGLAVNEFIAIIAAGIAIGISLITLLFVMLISFSMARDMSATEAVAITAEKKTESLEYTNDVTQIYVRGLHADLEARGYEPKPLPEELTNE